MAPRSICHQCRVGREIISGKGSKFLLCGHGLADPSWPKYPVQPVIDCRHFSADAKPPGPAPPVDGR